MLNKLKEIYDIANNLWHEDAYDMSLTCGKKGWKLIVMHRYVGKTDVHPESEVFKSEITDETVDAVIGQLKAKFIDRARNLAEFRKNECDGLYKQLTVANEEFTKRLFLLEEFKKV